MTKRFSDLFFQQNAESYLADNAQTLFRQVPQGERGALVANQVGNEMSVTWWPARALLYLIEIGGVPALPKKVAKNLLEQCFTTDENLECLVAVEVRERWWIGVLKFNPPEPQDIAA